MKLGTILGTYTIKLKGYSDININGYDDPELIGFVVPDEADNFLHDIGALDLDISPSSGGEVNIEWEIELLEYSWGFNLDDIRVERVYGVLKFDVTVPDPLNDDNYQEFEHSMEFDSGEGDDWFVNLNYHGLSIDRGVRPREVDINIKDKTIMVTF